jgi:hypothetical protein
MEHCRDQGPDAQAYHPPFAVLIFEEVGVTRCLNGVAPPVAVAKDRIVGARFIRPSNVPASLYGNHVSVFGAALREHKVVPAVDEINMRGLWKSAAAAKGNTS